MTRPRSSLFLLFAAAALLALLLAGCSSSSEQEEGSGVQKGGKDASTAGRSPHIVYRLKWLYNASTLGELYADRKGLFKAAGLDVEIREGGAEHDAIKEIELGRAMFGVASADQVIRAAEKGADVVVLAQIFQKNPLQWICIKERVSFSPEDPASALKNYRFGITYGGNDEAIFIALARKLGLDPESLDTYAITYDYAPFWQNRVQFWPVYRNTQGIVLERRIGAQGQHASFLDPSRYGIDFVANSLITSSKILRHYPNLVERFTSTLLSAWQQALDRANRKPACQILMEVEPGLDEETASAQIEATGDMVIPEGGKAEIGLIDQQAWQQTLEIMRDQGLISAPVALERLLAAKVPAAS